MWNPKSAWYASWLLGLTLSGCSSSDPTSAKVNRTQASVCDQDIDAPAARLGAEGRAVLLYSCQGAACTGKEHFAAGLQHAVAFEVEAAPESVLHIASNHESVVGISDVVSTFDPCASKLKAWATLDAREAGQAVLELRDARGVLDRIDVSVATPASIRLRATRAAAFAFESPSPDLLAAEGESWLVLPDLYDANNVLLVGLPELTWEVDDPSVAEVRTTPENADEQRVREHSGLGAAFVQAKRVGETGLRVQADNGAKAEVLLRVLPP